MESIQQGRQKKIAMLICYFGKAPWYFKYFTASCAYNPTVDFLLITDMVFTEELPPNIIIVKSSLKEVKELATRKLGFEAALDRAYKLCDFKPSYGFLFSELTEKYDFWGLGDIDVIYGDIRKFITDDMLDHYDVISVRPEYVSGFFALFRNDETGRNLFMKSPDYRKVFSDDENYCFDETNWQWLPLVLGKSIFQVKCEIQCMTYVVKKLELCGEIKAHFKMLVKEGKAGKLEWNKGRLIFDHKEEFLLYHFIEFKGLPFIHVPRWQKIPDRIFINKINISAHPPRSLAGMGELVVLNVLKWFHNWGEIIGQYRQWKRKAREASAASKLADSQQWNKLVGSYSMPDEELVVNLSVVNGRLFAQWGENKVELLQLGDNRFVLNKFEIDNHINAEIKFLFNTRKANDELHVSSFRRETVVLVKEKKEDVLNDNIRRPEKELAEVS